MKRKFLNLFLAISCFVTMSFTADLEEPLEPNTKSRILGWSNMACVPNGQSTIELSCRQCYYVFWIALDCKDCINYVGASNNQECK
jgi:hypothetical protein